MNSSLKPALLSLFSVLRYGFYGLALAFIAPLSHAENADTLSTQEISATSNTNPVRGQNVVLARPIHDVVPSFLNDLDTHLMSDELVNKIESDYALRLREFSLKQGFQVQNRDTRMQRNYLGNPQEEVALRKEIARSMRQYMIIRGIPRYLSSKPATRSLGEGYQEAVAFAQNATRIEIKSRDDNWNFGSGINPFTAKAWAKFTKKASTIELYNYFDRGDTLGIVAFTRIRNYIPNIHYYIQKNAISPGVSYNIKNFWESEFRIYIPFAGSETLDKTVSYFSSTYRF